MEVEGNVNEIVGVAIDVDGVATTVLGGFEIVITMGGSDETTIGVGIDSVFDFGRVEVGNGVATIEVRVEVSLAVGVDSSPDSAVVIGKKVVSAVLSNVDVGSGVDMIFNISVVVVMVV